jgi:hypothetical protein
MIKIDILQNAMENSTKNSEAAVAWIIFLFSIIGALALFFKEWTN